MVSAPDRGVAEHEARDHLTELESLTDTAGATVVATVQQNIESPHPAYYIGTGKVDELRDVVVQSGATLAIADEVTTWSKRLASG